MRSPASGSVGAEELIAEIGVDMTASPPPRTWCRGPSSPPRPPAPPARKAAPPARATRGWAPPSARSPWGLPTNTFLGDRYRRLVKRRGKKRALVAVGNSVLTIVWHLLSDPEARFHDLGVDFYDRLHPNAEPVN